MHGLADWLILVGVVIAAVQLAYTAIPFHAARRSMIDAAGKTARRPVLIMAALTMLTWAAVGYSYYDRHHEHPAPIIQSWGTSGPTSFYLLVDVSQLEEYASGYKMMFIIRASYANIDRMTDKAILKSSMFTIGHDPVAMMGIDGLRGLNIMLNTVIQIEYNVAILPFDISPEQIIALRY